MSTGAVFDNRRYYPDDTDAISRQDWGWYLALGIALIILGVVAIIAAVTFTIASVLLFGVLFMVAAVFQFIQAFSARGWRGVAVSLLLGLLYLIVGGIIAADPLGAAVALTLVLGIFFLVAGVFRIVYAIQLRQSRSWGWQLFSGVLNLLLGGIILAGWPALACG